LKQQFCGMVDSITKTVKIDKPTAAPVADFIAVATKWKYSIKVSCLI